MGEVAQLGTHHHSLITVVYTPVSKPIELGIDLAALNRYETTLAATAIHRRSAVVQVYDKADVVVIYSVGSHFTV